jgi:hypothetical protein
MDANCLGGRVTAKGETAWYAHASPNAAVKTVHIALQVINNNAGLIAGSERPVAAVIRVVDGQNRAIVGRARVS